MQHACGFAPPAITRNKEWLIDRWTFALQEHELVVAEFAAGIAQVSHEAWHRTTSPTDWSASALALHVCQSYTFGVAAAAGGPGMRLRTPWVVAWFARTFLLPRLLAAQRFPRGARAPSEVVPDPLEARELTQEAAIARLQRVASEAVTALQDAALHRPGIRITHAYFGPLKPYLALRLLSAHTRHHTAGLARRR